MRRRLRIAAHRGPSPMLFVIAIASASISAVQVHAQSTSVTAPSKHSGVLGVVRDSLDRPIRLARVFVDGSNTSTVSDDSGQFELRGLSSGVNGFTVSRIGYAPVSFETTLPPDSLVVLSIRLRAIQVLDPVKVNAERVNTYLTRTGFVERRRVGLGSYLSPTEVDSIANVIFSPSQFLRGLRGIDCRGGSGGGSGCVPVSRGRAACLMLFVDGTPMGPARLVDSLGLNVTAIAAVEVYDRATAVPLEFQAAPQAKSGRGLSTAAGCGAIVLWTKTRIPHAP